MKLIHILFGFLLALLLLIGFSFFSADAFRLSSTVHPLNPAADAISLLKSSKDVSGPIWKGFLMSILILGIMACCILLGVSKGDKIGPYFRWISLGFVFIGVIFLALTLSYSTYTGADSTTFFGGYPSPTAWMIYGVWIAPLALIFLFSFTFDRWFLKPEDLQNFRELVEASSEEEGGAAP